MASCETCKFAQLLWREGDEYTYYSGQAELNTAKRAQTNLECRRYAPRGMISVPENAYSVDHFAVVKADDWCGEYQPKADQ